MSAIIFDSRELVTRLSAELKVEAGRFKEREQRSPHLAQVIVGHDLAAEVYSRQIVRASKEIGLVCTTYAHPFEISEQDLRANIARLNAEVQTDGIVLLLPLPEHIRQRVITDVLAPEKDVDGLGARNAGNLSLGFPSFVPGTADAVLTVLQASQIPVTGLHAVIVGRSNVGGKPIALTLLRENATVTLCHSHTRNLPELTRSADLLVVSTGRPHSITAEMVKLGAIVLDAGINLVEGKVVGDIDFASVREVASFLTPVPHGLGPLTRLMLLRHTLLGPC
jgi:methylenetetrahydrofolate dehydrogenase (NADP+)/methenyltetrahydrofolate cyclohydrolase